MPERLRRPGAKPCRVLGGQPPPPDEKARRGVSPAGRAFSTTMTKTTTFGGESECRWHHRLTRTVNAQSG